MPRRFAVSSCAVLLALGACYPTDPRYDSGLGGLALHELRPELVVPGSRLEVRGRSFVNRPWGEMRLRIRGTLQSSTGADNVELALPLSFVDVDNAYVEIDPEAFVALGGRAGELTGQAWVEAESFVDGDLYTSEPAELEVALRSELRPELVELPRDSLIFPNDLISIDAAGLLLGGGEGQTYAVIEGCVRPIGGASCAPTPPFAAPVEPLAGRRDRGQFVFSPAIAGIEPGVFEGEVFLENRHAHGPTPASGPESVRYQLHEPEIFEASPGAASLGQYVYVRGGGFVGAGEGNTLLEFRGAFYPSGQDSVPADLLLIPEFVSGREVRYVMAEDDSLGRRIDLRFETGRLAGTVEPITSHAGVDVRGRGVPFTLQIAPVKQIVEIRFLRSYGESLRRFGLRAVDEAIRERVLDVVDRDYATINLEARRGAVEDFALYSIAEIAGQDPNGLGLLGYDNTPGKDVGNERLYDRIGGVNALTQEDGFPGYGGVFIESLLQFSGSSGSALSDPTFDEIFDPFRPERGGTPVSAADLAEGLPRPTSGSGCPAPRGDRQQQIACAIWVLGSLIGTTLSHEIGHSLGLANPYGQGFHNQGSAENRLMDAGAFRPFLERAELHGHGPGRFCDEEYEYLRVILPTDLPMDLTGRPRCF
jgi:hypothetical protein